MKSIHLSTDLLNYEDCANDMCIVDRKNREQKDYKHPFTPDEVWRELLHGGSYYKAEVFKSPLFKLGEKLEHENATDFDEIIFSGDARKVDLRWWSYDYFFDQTNREIRKHLPHGDSQQPKVLRFENEVEFLNLEDFPIDKFILYINNYSENVEVKGIDERKKDHLEGHLFFCAPKPNAEPADGKLVKLTKAYSFWDRKYNSEYFWSMPITLHSRAVTYIEEKKLDCYESHQHVGTRLYFIGIVPKELTEEEKQRFVEGYPYVDVWESPEYVVNKLKQAGWHMN